MTRERSSDYLKAASIVAVVCIHAALPLAETLRFCVPAFVAVWAYYLELGLSRRTPGESWPYLATRALKLFVPYLFWTVVYLLAFHGLWGWRATPAHTVVGGWFGGYGWAGQYFFIILFQLTGIVPLVRRVVGPRTLLPLVAAGAALNVVADYVLFKNALTGSLGDRLFVYWLPYVFLGVAFARGFPRRLPWLLPAAAAALSAAPIELRRLASWQPRASPYLTAAVTLGSCALLLGLAPRRSCRPAQPAARDPGPLPWLPGAVAYVGRNSMAVFVCHLLVLHLCRPYLPQSDDARRRFFQLGSVAVAVAASLAVAEVLRYLGLGLLVGAAEGGSSGSSGSSGPGGATRGADVWRQGVNVGPT